MKPVVRKPDHYIYNKYFIVGCKVSIILRFDIIEQPIKSQ